MVFNSILAFVYSVTEREREASLASPKFWRKGREKEDQEQAERKKGKWKCAVFIQTIYE